MYTCTDHDFSFGSYLTWFFRVYFVECANEHCEYYKQLGTRSRFRKRPRKSRKLRVRE